MLNRLFVCTTLLCFLLFGCQPAEDNLPFQNLQIDSDSLLLKIRAYEFDRSGKIKGAGLLESVFSPTLLDTLVLPELDSSLEKALYDQANLLNTSNQKPSLKVANLTIRKEELHRVIDILLLWKDQPEQLKRYLDAYQIWGEDRRGHVKMTGYFTPVLEVRKTPNEQYRFPIYRRPKNWTGPLPSRQEIEREGILAGLNLEIGYASDPIDIYYMQLQGSGYVEFQDTGERLLLIYDGSNKRPYRSIEKYLLRREDLDISDLSIRGIKRYLADKPELRDTVLTYNESYTFFTPGGRKVKGAGQVPLTEGISVAVDKRYLPLGSVLLGSVPVYDNYGEVIRHEFRLLLAQDVGGIIRGPGHIDLYSGVGKEGQNRAGRHFHFGRIWLLSPKPDSLIVALKNQ